MQATLKFFGSIITLIFKTVALLPTNTFSVLTIRVLYMHESFFLKEIL